MRNLVHVDMYIHFVCSNRLLSYIIPKPVADKVKQRISRSEYNYIKLRNKFLRGIPISRIIPFSSFFKKKFFNLLESSNKYELKFNDQQIKTLKSIYSKTNHKLSRNYKLNLSKWLYPM